eukprot:3933026-Rhodomonas_salina.2
MISALEVSIPSHLSHNLVHLNLSALSLGCDAVRKLAAGLGQCTVLQRLELSNNKIGENGATQLAECLSRCVALSLLDLSFNAIRTGVRPIAEALGQCLELTSLSLRANALIPGALESMRALSSCRKLSCLELAYNRLSPAQNNSAFDFLSASISSLNLRNTGLPPDLRQQPPPRRHHVAGPNRLEADGAAASGHLQLVLHQPRARPAEPKPGILHRAREPQVGGYSPDGCGPAGLAAHVADVAGPERQRAHGDGQRLERRGAQHKPRRPQDHQLQRARVGRAQACALRRGSVALPGPPLARLGGQRGHGRGRAAAFPRSIGAALAPHLPRPQQHLGRARRRPARLHGAVEQRGVLGAAVAGLLEARRPGARAPRPRGDHAPRRHAPSVRAPGLLGPRGRADGRRGGKRAGRGARGAQRAGAAGARQQRRRARGAARAARGPRHPLRPRAPQPRVQPAGRRGRAAPRGVAPRLHRAPRPESGGGRGRRHRSREPGQPRDGCACPVLSGAEVIGQCGALATLELSENAFGAAGVAQVVAALPQCGCLTSVLFQRTAAPSQQAAAALHALDVGARVVLTVEEEEGWGEEEEEEEGVGEAEEEV